MAKFAGENIEINSEDTEEIFILSKDPRIYEKVIMSVSPSIYGYEAIKEALALQLFSGVNKVLPDGSKIGGGINILLVGDPSTGKSKLILNAIELSPKGVYTVGGSTLKRVISKADGGLLAIDDFHTVSQRSMNMLLKEVKYQSFSLLCSAEPSYGRFDVYEFPWNQIDNLPSNALSEFDLIFPIMDMVDENLDQTIAQFLVQVNLAGEFLSIHRRNERDAPRDMGIVEPKIPVSLLRKYITYSRENIFPVMDEEAMEHFMLYHVSLRKDYNEHLRIIETLVRLGEASARLRLSDEVTVNDADRAIYLLDGCLKRLGFDKDWEGSRSIWGKAGKAENAKRKRHALKLLRDFLGDEIADQLIKEKYVIINSVDGKKYMINKKGNVYNIEDGELKCVAVAADDLPKYDEILAKYLVIRDKPKQIDTLNE